MKTINTIMMGVVGTAAGSTVLSLSTGLPLPFAVLAVVALVSMTFAATVMVGALVHPMRAPLSISRARGRFTLAAPSRPITRPARVAA